MTLPDGLGDRHWTHVASYADATARAAMSDGAARVVRRRIEQQEGGILRFRRRLRVALLGDPEAGELEDFYRVLRVGILPSELVPVEDFTQACGPKNADAAFQKAIGPYRYFGLALRAADYGTIGAAGFAVFCHHRGPATIHASYYALLPQFRRLGLGRLLLDAVTRTAVHFVSAARPAAFDAGPVVQFIEVNDIADMTLGERLLDQVIAVHPLARDAMWERMGFREIMDVRYRQRAEPPIKLALKAILSDVARTDGNYSVKAIRAPLTLMADVVRRHVSAFDNLLMNYDEACIALQGGHPLPDPIAAGLLARFGSNAVLSMKPLDQALRYRQDWKTIDEQLSRCIGLSLDQPMQALRNQTEKVSSPPRTPDRVE